MQFGVFSLMGYREPGTPTTRILEEAAEQTRLADALGYDVAWFAEHHFSNYCVCPSPLMMIAHCAATTQTIRLGTAVVVVPLYTPARLLAEIGMADAISGGRLILGIGSGYQPYEFDRFEVDLSQSKSMTEEFMDMYDLAFTQETFSFDGEHYKLPDTHISARPANSKPEVWIAGDNPIIHRMAARRGYVPMVTGRFNGPDYLRSMRHAANLRRREEVMDGAMLVETPTANEPPIEEIVDNLLIGDCAPIAEKLVAEINAGKPSHMMFHFQVGSSGHHTALESIEKFQSDIKPMVEKALGPLDQLNEWPTQR